MARTYVYNLGALFLTIAGLSTIEWSCAASGPILCRKYLEKSYCAATGTTLDAEGIFDLARVALGKGSSSGKEESIALRLVEQEWSSILSYIIKKIKRHDSNVLGPIKVILGGGIIDYNHDILKMLLAKNVIPRGIDFVFSTLGDARAILGAVAYTKSLSDLQLLARRRYAIGIDLGGTHIRVALVDIATMQVVGNILKQKLFQHRSDAERMADFSERMLKNKSVESFPCADQFQHAQLANIVLDNIANLVKKAVGTNNIAFVAMSSAGSITDDGYCTKATFLPFSGVYVKRALESRVNFPVTIAHDIFCGALGEKTVGAGKDAKRFVFVALGTFIGVQLFDSDTWDCRNF